MKKFLAIATLLGLMLLAGCGEKEEESLTEIQGQVKFYHNNQIVKVQNLEGKLSCQNHSEVAPFVELTESETSYLFFAEKVFTGEAELTFSFSYDSQNFSEKVNLLVKPGTTYNLTINF